MFSAINPQVIPIAGALAALAIKMLAVTMIARCMRGRGAWPAAWMAVQATITAAFLAASAFHVLVPLAAWLLLAAILCAACVLSLISAPRPFVFAAPSVALCIFAGIVAALLIRSNFLSDPTWDGQTYGLVRLAIWMNYRSLFVVMPTSTVNIFTNEWNGELVSLLYGLTAGNVQGFALGGVEILIVTFLALRLLFGTLNASPLTANALSALLACTPAMLGLSLTVKGDLLACAAVAAAAAWLSHLRATRDPVYLLLTLAALGLAVGSKISSVFVAIPLLLAAGYSAINGRPVPHAWRHVLCGGMIGAIFCARYFVNIHDFGDPIARARDEAAQAGWHLAGNLILIARQWIEPFYPPEFTALAGGFGAAGFLMLLALPLAARNFLREHLFMMSIGSAGALAGALVIGSWPYGLRYFLPSLLLVIAPVLAAAGSSRSLLGWARPIDALCAVVIAANLWLCRPPNEIVPAEASLAGLATASPITRSTAFFRYFPHDAGIAAFDLDTSGKRIAIFTRLNRPVFIFSGSRAQNQLLLTDSGEGMDRLIRDGAPYAAVIAKVNPTAPATQQEKSSLSRCGDVVDNNWFVIAKCR